MARSGRRFRLAVVASHPVQYYAPWYRALAARVDLRVFFAHRITPADHARSGFGVPFEWDVPLLDGYPVEWLHNVSRRPGVESFRGCDTPGVAAAIDGGGFDALLVTGWNLWSYWQAIASARRLRIPALVRGDSQLTTPRRATWRAAKRLVYPRLLGVFDACLTVGRRNREYYREYGVSEDRLFASPHCVDNEFFATTAAAARGVTGGARGAFDIPDNAVVFLFAGKLIEKKRPLDWLAALGRLRQAGFNAWGLVAGDGPLRGEVEAYQQRHGTVCTLAGFLNQRQMGAAYAAADALVVPSDGGETWGLVVNEAMACGLPVIASDQIGCAPDLVIDSSTGFTYRCGDVEGLAHQMTRLANDPPLRRELGARAAVHIRGFSPDAAAAGVLQALTALKLRQATAA
jgi:glycosyltransferase involved in cell wall biosynthesis